MLFKSEVGERTQTEIPVFEREVRQATSHRHHTAARSRANWMSFQVSS